MSDSKKKTTSEVLTNMVISFPIHFAANFIILPFYGADIQNNGHDFLASSWTFLQLGGWFTIVSFIRLFILRRIFNRFAPDEIGYNRLLQRFRKAKK